MKKRTAALNANVAACLTVLCVTGMMPIAQADTYYAAATSALSQDHLLHDAALQQQSHTPLVRMPRHHASGRDAISDPDAIYVQYDQGDSEHAGVAGEADVELRHPLLLTGGEYQVSPQWLVGANLGRLEQTLQFADSEDQIDTRTDLATLYTQWGRNGFTTTALAGYQQGEIETSRALLDGGTALGEADTHQQLFSLAGRYSFHEDGWRYGPFSRLDLSRGDIDAHTEANDNTRIEWQNRTSESRIFSMGVHGTYLFDVGSGSLAPYFTLATRKEFHPKRDTLDGTQYIGDTSVAVMAEASPRDERWHEATIGLRLALEKQLLINAEFAQALDLQHQDLQTLSMRADWIFQGL